MNIRMLVLMVTLFGWLAVCADSEASKIAKAELANGEANRISKQELAEKVADCYTLHQLFATEFYKSGDADGYKEIISSLVGEDNLNRVINSASHGRFLATPNSDRRQEAYVKERCSDIEEKVAMIN